MIAENMPIISILLKLSFNIKIPNIDTKTGVEFAKNDTRAGFVIVFIAMKKAEVPINSNRPINMISLIFSFFTDRNFLKFTFLKF